MDKCVKCDAPATFSYKHTYLKDNSSFEYAYCSRCAGEVVSRPETTWEYSEDLECWWCRECGLKWVCYEGEPEENSMNYCPKCGRNIAIFKGGGADS